MIPTDIIGATRHMKPPPDWDETKHGSCGTLAIVDRELYGAPTMTSAWYPTTEEISEIIGGKPVMLTIVGTAQPPVMVWVELPVESSKPIHVPTAEQLDGQARGSVIAEARMGSDADEQAYRDALRCGDMAALERLSEAGEERARRVIMILNGMPE